MKKLFTLLAITLTVFSVKAQMAVTAPSLELLTKSNVTLQQKTLMENMQSQINTLNTSKNTLESLEKIKEIDNRITQVNARLKQARVVYNIFNVGSDVLKNANSTATLLTQNRPTELKKYADSYLTQLQVSVDDADNIVSVCKDILSGSYKMNDFERLTLLNSYYEKINTANSKIKRLNKSYRNMLAISRM